MMKKSNEKCKSCYRVVASDTAYRLSGYTQL